MARPTTKDIHEVCQVRKGIEWVATGVAAAAMPLSLIQDLRAEAVEALEQAGRGNYEPFFESDSRIHRKIVESTANERLIQVRTSVEPFVYWLRVLGATGTHRLAGSTKRHLEILDAMVDRDAELAQKSAATHLDEVEAWTVSDMESDAIKT